MMKRRSTARMISQPVRSVLAEPASATYRDFPSRSAVTASLASEYSKRSQRLGSIDALRGTAMLFVFLAHFTSVYLWRTGARDLALYLGVLSMIGSPTFVAVSGIVAGFLAATNPAGFRGLRVKLLDRGVFLLIIGHLILTLAVMPSLAGFPRAYRTSFITDAIAVSIVVGPWLIDTLGDVACLALAAATFLLNWWAVIRWQPGAVGLVSLKQYFIGVRVTSETGGMPVFAVIPWLAVYLAAAVLGRRVGKMYSTGDRKAANRFLARVGGSALLFGAVLHGVTMLLRRLPASRGTWDSTLLTSFSIYQKFPPGPVYLAFFGGTGIMLLAAILEIDCRGKMPTLMSNLQQIGRASLITFIAQYALYVGVISRLRLPYTPFWPVLFMFSIIVLARVAAVWDRHDGNRFLTVGITSLLRRDRIELLARKAL